MNKDVIYIDVEDDVTAIIGKVKAAKEKIVAVVPPKRPGALQSAVNLRLLDRMAKTEKKKLVLITNNQALVALAANANIPVAKNLQSKPEVASVPALAVDDGDDIIDGGELPVGEHAAKIPVKDNTRDQLRSDAIETIDIDDEVVAPVALANSKKAKAAKANKGSKVKIPNFDTFRKKLIIGIIGGVLLIALLIWMFVFAPAATVIITARTTPAPISTSVTLVTDGETNVEEGVLRATMKENQVDETIEFDVTGTDQVGERATGQVSFRNCEDDSSITLPAGTTVTSNGRSFTTNGPVTVAGGSGGFGGCSSPGVSPSVGVTATDIGADYNVANGTTFSVAGHPNQPGQYMRAVATTAMSGGSSREAEVPTQGDVERAQGDLIGRSTDGAKEELASSFGENDKVIDSSFNVARGDANSSPAVGEEAKDGKATLTIPTTYTMYAVSQSDLEGYLDSLLDEQLVGDNQRVYENGYASAQLSNFTRDGDTITATLTATGQVGPKIDEAALKEQVKGKRYGDVQATLKTIEGIQDVDVRFSYPWVWSVPGNTDKIDIEFKIESDE
ncbi:hypothetical protein CL689_06580 [Candidatus Saccharibacteria bacterium]|nr:hypothetical protein [Candidatus Saccharibacteria bacterium]MBJ58176.1 hypothetical protein [Candidatus Saccharibacteria bacterium]MBQ69708.1 hypothetical protein [Candidatus Saccharibacteria bacterium]|tara:strand:+ start:2082 stop:3764 length:1683 start_codon:yes stop_codon:yes gene_type:complete